MSTSDAYRRAVNPYRWELFTTLEWPLRYPDAEGEYVVAEDGRRFLDLVAEYGAATLGHRHPAVLGAVERVLHGGPPFVASLGLPDLAGPLAERLCSLAGAGLARAYFCTGGAEAIEVAMKFAMAATGRDAFVSFEGGYHGLLPWALSLVGNDQWLRPLPGWSLPGRFQIPFEDVERVEDVLDRTPIAAVVVEPVQGIGGAKPWAPDRLRALLECCRSHGTLVIVDEVLTGVGRTGDWFAFQHAGIEPDVVVTSKGLTGGIVPVAAVLMTERVHRSVYSSMERAMAHQVTFEAHLLGMSVATAVLDVVEAGGLVDRAAAVGVRLRAVLDDMRSAGRGIIGVRGRGLLVAFQVAPTGDPSAAEDAALCMELLMERGVLVYPPAHAPGWLKLTPPLTMSDASVEAFRSALEDALKELTDYRAAS